MSASRELCFGTNSRPPPCKSSPATQTALVIGVADRAPRLALRWMCGCWLSSSSMGGWGEHGSLWVAKRGYWHGLATGCLPVNASSSVYYPTSHTNSLPGDSRLLASLGSQGRGAPGFAAVFTPATVCSSICSPVCSCASVHRLPSRQSLITLM